MRRKVTETNLREIFKFPYYLPSRYNNYKDSLLKLGELCPGIKDAIENGTEFEFSIDVHDLNEIYPLNRPNRDKYRHFTDKLSELGVKVNILTRRNKIKDPINLIKLDDKENTKDE